jgi:foldase protein PrsA
MKKYVSAVLALVAVMLVSAFVVACGDSVPQGAVAKVGDGVVTQDQFNAIIKQAKAQAKAQGQSFPKTGTADYDQYAARVVDYLVTQELINQAATGYRVNVTDKQVQKRIDQILKAYGGKKKVAAILKQQGMTWKDLDQLMKYQLVSQAVYNKVIKSAKVSDKQIAAYFNKNKSQYGTPESRTTRHILVKTKAEAEQVRAQLEAGASWKDIAKQYSTDPSTKNNGGALGAVQTGQMVPAFEKAAFALKLNEISQPVKTQFGWHIIEVTKIVKAKKASLAKAKASIKATLLAQKEQTVWQKWLAKAKKDAALAYAAGFNPTVLSKHSASPTPSAGASSSPKASSSAKASPSPRASQ